MLRLSRVIKPWKESGALNAQINLYGFWNQTTFLTKSGDLGMVLSVRGVDYESLDHAEQEYAVKRLEAALKHFGPGLHVYQYLFKRNRPEIPFATYRNPLVRTANENRRRLIKSKLDSLFEIEIFYVVLLEGSRSKHGIFSALARLPHDPTGVVEDFRAQFMESGMKTLLRAEIERNLARLEQRVSALSHQLSDFVEVKVLGQEEQFTFFRRLMNYDE